MTERRRKRSEEKPPITQRGNEKRKINSREKRKRPEKRPYSYNKKMSLGCPSDKPMLSWRSGKARIWGTKGPRFEPHSSHPSEVPAAVDPWANRGSLKDASIAQIRAVSRGGILPAS
ncbi:hypothetical protein E3N88_17639 [Mikania micrantha]|uniref:Uncharacterized protein n=1 Tax=Mikania micrantha TaxID=192012 RepID=A0A5N6NU83_9ASTR|nr:hypothetical protein E3N88_17639 [Mikania micrantha]